MSTYSIILIYSFDVSDTKAAISHLAWVTYHVYDKWNPLSDWHFSIHPTQPYPAGGDPEGQDLQSSWLLHGQQTCACLGNLIFFSVEH